MMRTWLCLSLALWMSVASSAQDKVDLRLQLKPGQTYPLSIETHQDITQTFMDQTQQTTQETLFTYLLTVDAVDAEGVMSASVTYERLRSRQDGAQGSMTFDSAAKVATESPLGKVYGAVAGQSLKVKLAPSGVPLSVEGADALVARILEGLQPEQGVEADTMRQSIEAQYGKAALLENIRRNLEIYPEQPVAVGESWTRKSELATGFPVTTETTYTLKAIENGVATVDLKSAITATHSTAQPVGGQGKMAYDLNGSQSGTMTLDIATGWYKEAQFEKELAGTIVFEGGAGESKKVPVTVKSKESISSTRDDAAPEPGQAPVVPVAP